MWLDQLEICLSLRQGVHATKNGLPKSGFGLIIGDLHGCIKTFKALLDKIGLTRNDNLYLLGDYVDGGADAKKVVDTILELIDLGHKIHCLRGNHKQMMLDYQTDNPAFVVKKIKNTEVTT
jgi:UDP-2,3-diacylglucosamine pyrophosphatase LpxH